MNNKFKISIVTLIMAFALITVLSTSGPDDKASASTTKQKYYTSIYIEDGDSLWSIAERYAAPESGSYNDFIDEVKQINDLGDSSIEYGCSLVIPQYK